MKQFLTVVQGRKFLLSILFSLIAIWLVGPYLAIAGKVPFGTLNSRIFSTILAALFFFSVEHFRHAKNFTDQRFVSEEIKQELLTLQKTIQNVLKTLHKNVLASFLFRYRKPWYLVLGPTHSGKTTLLNKAELNIKGLDNLPPMTITPTKFFDWWLAQDAVFIDVGGRYLRETKESSLNIEELFQGFSQLLKKYRAFKPFNGLILTVNLQELTVNTREHPQLQKLRLVINELVTQFQDFPIYLIITRCDTIEGFVDFFDVMGPEERNQIFGINFPIKSHLQSLPQLFNEEFNALLTRLNERVIWRMQQENNVDKLGIIKNFPLQLEFLKNPLAKLLNVILPNTHVNLRGIFFTSAFQKDAPIDNLKKSLAHAFDIHHLNHANRITPPKTFFIPEIFRRIIFPESKFYAGNNSSHHRLHFITSLLVILITCTCLFLFFKSYKYNQLAIAEAQKAINFINQQPAKPNQDALVHKLNLLHAIINQLSHNQNPWYAKLGMQQTHKLKVQAEELYSQLLTTEFLNYLQQTLEIQLQNTQEENSNQIYAMLKVYLMLGEHKHFDPKFMLNWFNNYWHQLGNDSNYNENLNQHLSNLLNVPFKELKLNPQLVESKRALLNRIPQSRLVLTILQDQYQGSPVKLFSDRSSQTRRNGFLNTLPNEISGIYNIVNFKQVYYNEILATCKEITNGNWVLDLKAQPAFSEITLNQLSTEVKAIYLNEYAITWGNLLLKLKVDGYQNLNQVVEMLDLLNDPQSPLVELINAIKNNTQPLSDSIEFSQQISSRFLSLNSLSAEVLKNTNQGTLTAVREYLNKIIQSSDIDKSSYDAAKIRMENQTGNDAITQLLQQAKMLPDPLQTWHTTIAAESWRLILKNTQSYLNRIWVTTVFPQYQALLDNRYPLFKESTTDISLSDFSNFFGNNGTMDIFFKNYLQPFVDSSRLYWEWKNLDGQRINIPQNTLEMFIRAALIQKMFFPEDARFPAITFSLVPVELDSKLQSFSLDLEGQMVLFQKDNEQILSLSWPGPKTNHTEISFMDDQGKKSVITESGPWSWFKILDKSHLDPTNSPKHFKLTFEHNGATVQYELYTTGIVNPFIPGILNAFRCPEAL